MSDVNYTCAISGIEAGGDESGPPAGWTTLTIRRRTENPKLRFIQMGKQALLEQQVAQMRANGSQNGIDQVLVEQIIEAQYPLVSIQLDAQFHALESAQDQFIEETEEVHVATYDAEVLAEFNEILVSLGVDPIENESEDEDEDEDESEAPAEPSE